MLWKLIPLYLKSHVGSCRDILLVGATGRLSLGAWRPQMSCGRRVLRAQEPEQLPGPVTGRSPYRARAGRWAAEMREKR